MSDLIEPRRAAFAPRRLAMSALSPRAPSAIAARSKMCADTLERFPAGLSLFLPMGDSLTAANQIRSSLPPAARAIMAKGYSTDLRTRVVALVEAGDSCREVARLLDLPASTTIRWMELWRTTGSVTAKPGTGHCRSPLAARAARVVAARSGDR